MNNVVGNIILFLKMISLNDRFDNEKKDSRSLWGSFIHFGVVHLAFHSVHLTLTHKASIGAVFFPSRVLQTAVSISLWFPNIIWYIWEEDNETSAYVSLYLK